MFKDSYASVFDGSDMWKEIKVTGGDLFEWDEDSTYIHHPPYFQIPDAGCAPASATSKARACWACSATRSRPITSPRPATSPPTARPGNILQERGVQPKDFNSYGSRRGNDLVMARGTFANIRLKNLLVAPKEGNWTKHLPAGERDVHLRCGHAISEGRRARHRAGRQGIWHRLQPRLGGQGSACCRA